MVNTQDNEIIYDNINICRSFHVFPSASSRTDCYILLIDIYPSVNINIRMQARSAD